MRAGSEGGQLMLFPTPFAGERMGALCEGTSTVHSDRPQAGGGSETCRDKEDSVPPQGAPRLWGDADANEQYTHQDGDSVKVHSVCREVRNELKSEWRFWSSTGKLVLHWRGPDLYLNI